MAPYTGSNLVIQCLQKEGIKRIYTLVGDTILPLVDACADEGMELIDTRHEAAAVAMADAWCRITAEPAVVMVTGGPGFSNAISGLPNVFTSESPVIFIAGASELAEHGMCSFQEIDQISMAKPVTKGAWMINHTDKIPSMISKAFRTALSGRPGPVHLTIPVDVQEKSISPNEACSYDGSNQRHGGKTHGDPKLIQQAITLLSQARQPVIIAGNACRYSALPQDLEDLVESTGIPMFTLEQSRGLLSDSNPLCFGYPDASLNSSGSHIGQSDVILLLGKRLDHRFKYGRPPFFLSTAKIIQIDPDPTEIGFNRNINIGILGDIGAVSRQLSSAAKSISWPNFDLWTMTLRNSREQHRLSLISKADGVTPLHPMQIFTEIEPLIDKDSILIFDGGDYVQWGRGYLNAEQPGHWLRLGPLAHLGKGLPYALTARLAHPKAKIFLFMGDGSLGFYIMEFDTAIRHGLPFITILGNDSLWGIDHSYQLAYYGRPTNTTLRTIRYDNVIKSIGGHGEHVETAEQIRPAVERALASQKPSLIDITIRSARSPLADAAIKGGQRVKKI
jgi:acetolactate synthase-1/2/3 large subunit